jgi:hypothetical protein
MEIFPNSKLWDDDTTYPFKYAYVRMYFSDSHMGLFREMFTTLDEPWLVRLVGRNMIVGSVYYFTVIYANLSLDDFKFNLKLRGQSPTSYQFMQIAEKYD